MLQDIVSIQGDKVVIKQVKLTYHPGGFFGLPTHWEIKWFIIAY